MPKIKEWKDENKIDRDKKLLDFQEALIDLGIQLCKGISEGKTRNEAAAMEAVTAIYKAVREE